MLRYMKTAGWAVLALVIATVGWLLLRPEIVTVQLGTVQARMLTVLVEEQGRTRARDPFVVAAPITGKLLRPTLDVGDPVSSGQVIAHIAVLPNDRRTEAVAQANLEAAAARRNAAAASVQEAESAYVTARKEDERRSELFKNKLSSTEEVEHYRQLKNAAEARLLNLRSSLQAATAEVESARSLLLGSNSNNKDAGILTIAAPVAGMVAQLYEKSERVIQAGAPIISINADNRLEIIADLLTQDAVLVQAGQAIQVSGWGGNEVLSGTVLRVEPQAFTKISALGVEEQRVNVIGSLQQAPPQLGAEYRVEVGIVVWQADAVLTVPASAVFQRNGHWFCFVVTDGKAGLREFEPGHRNRDYFQVLGGLASGEQVVLFPSDLVVDGAKVADAG